MSFKSTKAKQNRTSRKTKTGTIEKIIPTIPKRIITDEMVVTWIYITWCENQNSTLSEIIQIAECDWPSVSGSRIEHCVGKMILSGFKFT